MVLSINSNEIVVKSTKTMHEISHISEKNKCFNMYTLGFSKHIMITTIIAAIIANPINSRELLLPCESAYNPKRKHASTIR